MKSKTLYLLLIPLLLISCNGQSKKDKYETKSINVYYVNKTYLNAGESIKNGEYKVLVVNV